MIIYRRKFIRIGEVWFDDEPQETEIDVIRCIQRSSPLAGVQCGESYTLLIDLQKSNDSLLSEMAKGTRYEIRRAGEKDLLIYEHLDNPDLRIITTFFNSYNEFALEKRIPKLAKRNLLKYSDNGLLSISCVSTADCPLVWHAYYQSKVRARLLYSASVHLASEDSSFRSLVGRANRYHHWKDILEFKARGFSTYDLGGWYSGNENMAKLQINQFKEGFGGQIVKNFGCEYAVNYKGKLYLTTRRVVDEKVLRASFRKSPKI